MTYLKAVQPMTGDEFEQQEALLYAQGRPVIFKDNPGKMYIIAEYDPMMVPPIWLVNDPRPHYPDELEVISTLFCPLGDPGLQVA